MLLLEKLNLLLLVCPKTIGVVVRSSCKISKGIKS